MNTQLTERGLADALKRAVPEPDTAPHTGLARATSVRRLADRVRTRRRTAVSAAAAAVAVVVAAPLVATRDGDGLPDGPAAAVSGEPGTVLAAIRRPLDLRTLAPSERCPVSPSRTFPQGGAGFTGSFTAAGNGPLYLAGTDRAPAVVTLDAGSGPRKDRAQKVIWVVDPDYGGPLLLRGGRIDAPGRLGFDHYLGAVGYSGSGAGDGKPHRRLLYLRGGLDASAPGMLTSMPSAVHVSAPGCYEVQVDGVGFSEHLVFRVVRAPR